jgi:ribonuclease VapC
MTVVLDASVVLAMLWHERGGDRVAAVSDDTMVSVVNLSEVVAKMLNRGFTEAQAREVAEQIESAIIPFDEDQAMTAGLLRASTRARGLSLGDRACIALATARGARIMTADRALADLDIGVAVEVIR